MLINSNTGQLIQMLELWEYKTGKRASEFVRIIDSNDGFKVGVQDYIEPTTELVSHWDNLTAQQATKIKQGILEAVRA